MNLKSLVLATVIIAPMLGAAGAEAATVDVRLWDKGSDAEMLTGMGYGGGPVDHAKLNMGLDLSSDRVPAGEVTFNVTNGSKETIHEMLVVPIAAEGKPPPYAGDENRIDEEGSGDLGEVSELDPGQSGALTLDLKPGQYLLLCNIPGHYMAGMWRVLTVTP